MGSQLRDVVRNANNTVGVRFSEELLAALDSEVARRQKLTPWLEVTRADVVREAVYKLLGTTPANTTTAATVPILEKHSSTKAVCRICGDSLPEGRKAICAKDSCFKEDKNARERERRKALRKG